MPHPVKLCTLEKIYIELNLMLPLVHLPDCGVSCEDELLQLCALLLVHRAAHLLAQLAKVDEAVQLARRLLQLQLLRERDVLGDVLPRAVVVVPA